MLDPQYIVPPLIEWFRRDQRQLPWRSTRDPYAIWVSEIMLQQTRVAAVIPFYERFLARFPTVSALAEASEPDLLAAWAGLGYYRRVRQLQQAARIIVDQHAGQFPRDVASIRALPGIGPYTAGAIASIAFGVPVAAVDGNVVRVVTRLTDDARLSNSAAVKASVGELLQRWMDAAGPGEPARDFTQAMMELGATVCTSRKPQCLLCPLVQSCAARRAGTVEVRPIKPTRREPIEEDLWVAVVEQRSAVLMRQRSADAAIMPGFWELPETKGAKLDERCFSEENLRLDRPLGTFSHAITVHRYRGMVWAATLEGDLFANHKWVPLGSFGDIPVTTITKKALRAKNL